MSVDALGNPLRFTLTGGQAHDITQADELIDGIESDYVIADPDMTHSDCVSASLRWEPRLDTASFQQDRATAI